MVCSNFHSTRVCKLCLFLFAQFIVPYRDTAIFITDYLSKIIRKKADLRDPVTLELIWQLAKSKFAIMDNSGYIATVGHFIDDHGLLFSNDSYQTGWWY